MYYQIIYLTHKKGMYFNVKKISIYRNETTLTTLNLPKKLITDRKSNRYVQCSSGCRLHRTTSDYQKSMFFLV